MVSFFAREVGRITAEEIEKAVVRVVGDVIVGRPPRRRLDSACLSAGPGRGVLVHQDGTHTFVTLGFDGLPLAGES